MTGKSKVSIPKGIENLDSPQKLAHRSLEQHYLYSNRKVETTQVAIDLTTNEWINKICCVHTRDYYSAI